MIVDYPLGVWPGLHAAIEVHSICSVCHRGPILDCECEPFVEVPVTEKMIALGDEAAALADLGTVFACSKTEAICRAMAAVAPHPPPLVWTKDLTNGVMTPHYPEREIIAARDREMQMSKAELCALRRKNQQWHDIWAKTEQERQTLEAANTALRSIAADLEDVQRQNVRLEAENARLRATFGPPTVVDLPDPARRPDGTLAPQPNPLPVLMSHRVWSASHKNSATY